MRNAQRPGKAKKAPPKEHGKGVAQTPPEGAPPEAPQPPPEPPPVEPAPPAPEPAPVAPPVEPAPPVVPETPEPEPEPMPIDDTGGEIVGDAEVIVITGSLVERRELTTPAPVTVIDRSDIVATGLVSVGDVVQRTPANSNALNQQINNGGDGSVRVGLRGLSSARTLTLMNGRRIVNMGVGADASVDLNMIPLAVIERVEVLKDGASAIYGSDAIGGVVNIITRDDFVGQEATIYTATTQQGDGNTYDLSFVTGAGSKKSNVVFSASYTRSEPVYAGDRHFSSADRAYEYHDDPSTPENEIGTISDAGSSNTPQGFLIADADGDGVLDPGFDPADFTNCDVANVGVCTRDFSTARGWRTFSFSDPVDFYNFQPANYLVTPSDRYSFFSTGNYRFHERIRGFFEAGYNHRDSSQELAPMPLPLDGYGIAIHADNAFNPYDTDIGAYRRRFNEIGNRRFTQAVDMFRAVVGVDGDLPEDLPFLKNWKWELSYNYGRTRADDINAGQLILSHVVNAIGPSHDSDGDGALDACGAAPGDVDPACVPLDLLGGYDPATGMGTVTPEMAAYLTYTGTASGYNLQKTYLATARGPLFNTPWGGFAVLALGADYREEAGGYLSDPLTATGDTTGNAVAPTDGSYDVVEGFGELSFVPVTGKPGVEWLEFAGAIRGYDYSTFGSGATYKGGLLLRTIGGLGLRGTASTAFRAPSIAELYSGRYDSFPSVTDPCDTSAEMFSDKPATTQQKCMQQLGAAAQTFINPQLQLREELGGNPDLDPETANTFTGGVIVEPPMVEGLTMTVDYWQIELDKAIQPLGAATILSQCYLEGQDEACAKVFRFPSGSIDFIDDVVTNIGKVKTNGVDITLGYNRNVEGIGTFRTVLDGTRTLNYEETDSTGRTREGVGNQDLGGFPKWKFNLNLLYGRGPIGVGTNWRYVHSFRECEDNVCNDREMSKMEGYTLGSRKIKAWVAGDLFANYSVKSAAGTTTIGVGINNVFDTAPPPIYWDAVDSDFTLYDFLGRYYYLRLSQMF